MTTTPTTQNIPQEQLDEEAARQYVRLRSYRKVAQKVNCSLAAAYERVQRWADRSEQEAMKGKENGN